LSEDHKFGKFENGPVLPEKEFPESLKGIRQNGLRALFIWLHYTGVGEFGPGANLALRTGKTRISGSHKMEEELYSKSGEQYLAHVKSFSTNFTRSPLATLSGV